MGKNGKRLHRQEAQLFFADPIQISSIERRAALPKSKEHQMRKIGFVGLGIMGTPMAEHLIKAGNEVSLYSISSIPASLIEIGGKACTSGMDVARNADIVFIMVPDTPNVAAALFGEKGIAEGLAAGKTVVDMSSISPIETKEFARKIRALGCDYLDAPVSGGEVGARNATLSIMVGGEQAVFDKVKPLFELMGKNITLVGENGDGQTTKVANQIIVALTIEAVGEALLFASKAGADPAKVRQALMGGFASSKILEVHGERMIKRTFNPGFRIELHQKDLNLALTTGRKLGLALPNTATCQELFNTCAANGGAAWDHSGMVKALELMANFEIGEQV
jgi:2-hydroxy-3-oxopropionate reductase